MSKKSRRKFILSIFTAISIYLVLIILLVNVESQSHEMQIKNLGDGLWYSIVTITTVGYGDIVPKTWLGKLIGGSFLASSLFLVSVLFSKVSEYFRKSNEEKKMGFNGTEFVNHIVIVGWDNFAEMIVDNLIVKEKKKVAVILNNKEVLDLLHQQYDNKLIFTLFASYSNVEKYGLANLDKSKVIFINLPSDTEKLVMLINLKKLYPDVNYLVALDDANLKETFESAGVTYVLPKARIAANLISSYIFEPHVAEFTADLMDGSSHSKKDDYDIRQYEVVDSNPFINKKYSYAFNELKSKYNTLLIGIGRGEHSNRTLYKLPDDDFVIIKGDHLIIICNNKSEDIFDKLFYVEHGI